MFELLKEELRKIEKRLVEEPKNQCWRRVYIRSMFSMIESECYRFKQEALFFCDSFSPGEVSLLEEKDYILNNKGEIEVRPTRLKLEYNLKFAFKALARAFDVNFELNLGDEGWLSFKNALMIRHHITHPKKIKNLNISLGNMDTVLKAFSWFDQSHISLFEAIENSMKKSKIKKATKKREKVR